MGERQTPESFLGQDKSPEDVDTKKNKRVQSYVDWAKQTRGKLEPEEIKEMWLNNVGYLEEDPTQGKLTAEDILVILEELKINLRIPDEFILEWPADKEMAREASYRKISLCPSETQPGVFVAIYQSLEEESSLEDGSARVSKNVKAKGKSKKWVPENFYIVSMGRDAEPSDYIKKDRAVEMSEIKVIPEDKISKVLKQLRVIKTDLEETIENFPQRVRQLHEKWLVEQENKKRRYYSYTMFMRDSLRLERRFEKALESVMDEMINYKKSGTIKYLLGGMGAEAVRMIQRKKDIEEKDGSRFNNPEIISYKGPHPQKSPQTILSEIIEILMGNETIKGSKPILEKRFLGKRKKVGTRHYKFNVGLNSDNAETKSKSREALLDVVTEILEYRGFRGSRSVGYQEICEAYNMLKRLGAGVEKRILLKMEIALNNLEKAEVINNRDKQEKVQEIREWVAEKRGK